MRRVYRPDLPVDENQIGDAAGLCGSGATLNEPGGHEAENEHSHTAVLRGEIVGRAEPTRPYRTRRAAGIMFPSGGVDDGGSDESCGSDIGGDVPTARR